MMLHFVYCAFLLTIGFRAVNATNPESTLPKFFNMNKDALVKILDDAQLKWFTEAFPTEFNIDPIADEDEAKDKLYEIMNLIFESIKGQFNGLLPLTLKQYDDYKTSNAFLWTVAKIVYTPSGYGLTRQELYNEGSAPDHPNPQNPNFLKSVFGIFENDYEHNDNGIDYGKLAQFSLVSNGAIEVAKKNLIDSGLAIKKTSTNPGKQPVNPPKIPGSGKKIPPFDPKAPTPVAPNNMACCIIVIIIVVVVVAGSGCLLYFLVFRKKSNAESAIEEQKYNPNLDSLEAPTPELNENPLNNDDTAFSTDIASFDDAEK